MAKIGRVAGKAAAMLLLLSSAGAYSQTLVVAGPGGATEERFKQHVIPPFKKANNVTVQYVAGQTTEILAKLEAQRSNQEYDVISLNDGPMFQAEERGFCAPLVEAPVYSELIPEARMTKNSIGYSAVASVITLNTKILADKGLPEPTSWLDLGDPRYEGEVALLSAGSSSTGMSTLVMVARANGGGETNIDPGFEYFKKKIKPNLVTVVQSSAKMSEMLQTGEVGIGVIVSSRAGALKAGGAPVKAIYPKEGTPIAMPALCQVVGSDVPDLAQKFIQHVVSVQGQVGFEVGEVGVNKNVPTDAGAPAGNKLIALDWNTINAKRNEWVDRWSREIE